MTGTVEQSAVRGRVAVVTGSTSGIGRTIARTLAESGAGLMLNGFGDAADIETERAELERRCSVRVLYSDADMRRPEQVRAMLSRAGNELGPVDILVNNAGIQHTSPVEAFPDQAWDDVIAVNLSAAFHATKAVVAGMRQRGWGRIINIASVHGLVASVDKVAYVSAKHGLVGMTRVVALENAGSGVTCNAICPGWVHTPLVMAQIEARAGAAGIAVEQATRDLLLEKQPSGAFTTAEEIAGAVLFLCSRAAANMTGTTLSLDGGWSAQ